MSKKTILIKKPLRGYAAGTELQIKVDKAGTPLERYWRDRLKDAKIDNCIEFVGKKKSTSASINEGGSK